MSLVDSHCHLNYPGLVEDQAGVIARARQAGVELMIAIGTKTREWPEVIAIAEREPDVVATVGVHPHEAAAEPDLDTATIVAACTHPRVVGIGETGLDYYYDKSPRDRQAANFCAHIHAAQDTGLPLVVHTRDAEADTLDILRREMARAPFTGVIHCFTASQAFAEAALALGFYISLSGIVTFKSARDLQETARSLPLEMLLVETDAPYLAPVPMRGKPCEPAFVAHTAAFVANLKGVAPAELARITTQNAYRLFHKAARP